RKPPPNVAQKLRRPHARHVDVRQQQLGLARFKDADRIVRRIARPHLISLASQKLRKGLQDDPILIEHQQARFDGGVGLKHGGWSLVTGHWSLVTRGSSAVTSEFREQPW